MTESPAPDRRLPRRAGQHAMGTAPTPAPKAHKAHPGWRWFFGYLAFTQLAAFVIAVVSVFHPVAWRPGFIGAMLTWPVLISPAWLGALAAFAAFWAAGRAWSALRGGQRPE